MVPTHQEVFQSIAPPQFPPRLLLLCGQLLHGDRRAHAGQVGVALPVLERGPQGPTQSSCGRER